MRDERHDHPELGGGRTTRPATAGDLVEQYRASNRPPPPSIQVAPLAEGEERLVQIVHRPDGNRNEVYLIHSGPDHGDVMGTGETVRFVAVIRSTDEADGREGTMWFRGHTLEALCLDIAMAYRNQPPPAGFRVWNAPEVEQLLAAI